MAKLNKINEIENLVRLRKSTLAKQAIAQLVKRSATPEIVFQCCDWYRRLGMLNEALRVLSLKDPLQTHLDSEDHEGHRLLLGARILNLMGASPLALQCLSYLECNSAEAFQIAGNIYLANWKYAEALHAFQEMQKRMTDKASYSARLQRLSLADAEAGVGHLESAIHRVQELLARTPEPLLQSILQSAIGEYLARKKDFKEALVYLEEAACGFLKSDKTADHGICLKWYALALAKQGKKKKAREIFERSLSLLRQPTYRPEVWIDVMRLQAECGFVPAEKLRELSCFPGLPEGLLRKMPTPEFMQFGSSRAEFSIDFTNEECVVGGKKQLRLPLEIKLLGYLRLSYGYGLSKIRALGLLWPDEPFSLPQLQIRLELLLNRLRERHKLELFVREGVINLSSASAAKVAVTTGSERSNTFLEAHPVFSLSDLKYFFQISDSTAWRRIQTWQEEQRIATFKKGRRSFFSVRPSSDSQV